MKFSTDPKCDGYTDAIARVSLSLQAYVDGKPVENAITVDEENGYVDVRTAVGIKRVLGKTEVRIADQPISKSDRSKIENAIRESEKSGNGNAKGNSTAHALPQGWKPGDAEGMARAFFEVLLAIEQHLYVLAQDLSDAPPLEPDRYEQQ